MSKPKRSSSGHRLQRSAGLSALLLAASTGVVMAANSGCPVALRWEATRAHIMVTRKGHHTAETLARWRVGAEAWSKAHHGRVYAGVERERMAMVWRPPAHPCADIALENNFVGPVLLGEAAPEFDGYASQTSIGDALAALAHHDPMEEALLAPGYGAPAGEIGPIDPSVPDAPVTGLVGSFSLPRVGPEQMPRRTSLLAPKHPPREVTLLQVPLPPPVVMPTPEPSAVVLLSTGIASLGLVRARRWLRV